MWDWLVFFQTIKDILGLFKTVTFLDRSIQFVTHFLPLGTLCNCFGPIAVWMSARPSFVLLEIAGLLLMFLILSRGKIIMK